MRDITPGQRWTSGLMLAFAFLVLAFGLPGATRTVFPAAADQTASPTPTSRDQALAPGLSFADTIVRPPRASPPLLAPRATDSVRDPAVLPVDGATAVAVAALYDPNVGVGDRTDEAMARRFLATASVPATFVPIGEPAATCDAVKGATLVVGGGALPAEIRACLHRAGIMSLSFDDDAALGAVGTAVSSRRGSARSLLDTASLASGQLTGHVGLVADERFRETLSDLVPVVRDAGLDITSVVWLAAGDPSANVALSLAGQGLSAVLFATSTQNQSTIGSQLRTLAPSTRLVVLDAADSITASSYPPLFDGALAVTSIQSPWHPGAEAQRATCRSAWEADQTPPTVLDNGELLRALTWCQHAAMAAAAAERSATVGVRSAVLALEVLSPVTSPLGILRDGGFGPTQITLATWAATCGCWSTTAPFARSGSAHG